MYFFFFFTKQRDKDPNIGKKKLDEQSRTWLSMARASEDLSQSQDSGLRSQGSAALCQH